VHGVPEIVTLHFLWGASVKILAIKPVAGASVSVELLPELSDFETIGNPLPELVQKHLRLWSRPGRTIGLRRVRHREQ
jgi:hypothetical protein